MRNTHLMLKTNLVVILNFLGIIGFKYDLAHSFDGDKAYVEMNNKRGYVDKTGKFTEK